ncbi:MAG: zinc-ribbon domain-containing protein [Candidatus Lokiarchaeota archaeon]|nr:zinc-ribbon domain-containing protein [Candidatus Lokiarchaeota archaeon]
MPFDEKDETPEDRFLGFAIPIGILFIVLLATGVIWLLIPIVILLLIFISNMYEERQMLSAQHNMDHWVAPGEETLSSGTRSSGASKKPIFDRKKQKEEGITCGTFIPIVIIGWLYVVTTSWIFLIPLFVLLASLVGDLAKRTQTSSEVREKLERSEGQSIPEIADRTGVPEERVRRVIVEDKRRGESDIWFDPETGSRTSSPVSVVEPSASTRTGCVYCGFALKESDRFCPYCGAPIMAR